MLATRLMEEGTWLPDRMKTLLNAPEPEIRQGAKKALMGIGNEKEKLDFVTQLASSSPFFEVRIAADAVIATRGEPQDYVIPNDK
jgi:hypothetical protein